MEEFVMVLLFIILGFIIGLLIMYGLSVLFEIM